MLILILKLTRQESLDEISLTLARHLRRAALLRAVVCLDQRDMDFEEPFLHPLLDRARLVLEQVPMRPHPREQPRLPDADSILRDELC